MSKLILNGTNGITGYKADNTTVQETVSLAELNSAKSDVFTSSSSLTISGKMTADASLTPAVLRYSVGEKELSGLSFEFVATNTEQFAEPDSTHTLPTGIQYGDLLVMLEHAVMDTGPGYGISIETPSAWTSAMGNNFVSTAYKPASNYWSNTYSFAHYKIAGSSDSGASYSGFQNPYNAYGTVYGQRTCFVYRPTFSNSGNVSVTKSLQGKFGTGPFSAYTSSVTATPSSTTGNLGIAQYASQSSGNTATLSGAVSSFDASSTVGYGSNGMTTCIRGSFQTPPTTSTVTLTGTANTTGADMTGIWLFTLS
jgi:hypothetical protein